MTTRRVLASVCIAMSLLLVACSSSTTPAPSTSSAGASAATSPAASAAQSQVPPPSEVASVALSPSAVPSPSAEASASAAASESPVPSVAVVAWKASVAAKPCSLLTTKQIRAATGSPTVSVNNVATTPGHCFWSVAGVNGTFAQANIAMYSPATVRMLKSAINASDPSSVQDGTYPIGSGFSAKIDVLLHGGGFVLDGSGTIKKGDWAPALATLAAEVETHL
jgi:hypothetical protein